MVTAHRFWFDDGNQPRAAEMGLFGYDHLCENWISGPYGRETIPSQPLHVDQLPPGLRDHLKQATLPNLRFAETVHIQPVEHFECGSWEPGWLGLDNVIRSFPGREDEYADRVDEMRDVSGPYHFEEPGGE